MATLKLTKRDDDRFDRMLKDPDKYFQEARQRARKEATREVDRELARRQKKSRDK